MPGVPAIPPARFPGSPLSIAQCAPPNHSYSVPGRLNDFHKTTVWVSLRTNFRSIVIAVVAADTQNVQRYVHRRFGFEEG